VKIIADNSELIKSIIPLYPPLTKGEFPLPLIPACGRQGGILRLDFLWFEMDTSEDG
jgi:hypothetical protein